MQRARVVPRDALTLVPARACNLVVDSHHEFPPSRSLAQLTRGNLGVFVNAPKRFTARWM